MKRDDPMPLSQPLLNSALQGPLCLLHLRGLGLMMAFAGLFALSGCPGTGQPASKSCERVGAQCKRAQGGLGVCSPKGRGGSLECTAQH